ncbi:MAG: hypothetical protein JWN70_4332 [Planctomycetaceae bacterium]|nr:hypothetical protein [Planctomycetaceae bacterium]
MWRCNESLVKRLLLSIGLLGLIVPFNHVSAQTPADKADEQIGEVFGKPVFRRDLGEQSKSNDRLHQLFLVPVLERYKAAHKKEIEPTKEEIDAATVVLDKEAKKVGEESEPEIRKEIKAIDDQLAQKDLSEAKRKELERSKSDFERLLEVNKKAPGRRFAVFMLTSWKFQKHLYDNYGGGRVLWQQGGTEAFDAMRKWLEAREKAGDFKITDKDLRADFYEYWTTHNHGAFLTGDPERIKDFVEPTWVIKSKVAKP